MSASVAPGQRMRDLDWTQIGRELDTYGCAVVQSALAPAECEALASLYPLDAPFRSRVVMARHGFGRGEYKYFARPLPEVVDELRSQRHGRLRSGRRHTLGVIFHDAA